MADNTVLNTGSGGDTIRDVAKTANSPAKTQVVIIDVGGGSDGSAETALALGQATAANSLPVVPASDFSSAKGSQPIGASPYQGVQQPKDSGRTYVTLTALLVTGTSTETLLSCTVNKGGTTSATQTSYTVTTGKTLRIQSVSATVKNTSTTVATGVVTLRTAASAIATTSPVVMLLDVGGLAATTSAGNDVSIAIPDGLEIAASQQIALSQKLSTTSATVSVTLVGYEY